MVDQPSIDRLIYRISHDLGASARALVELPKWIIEDLEAAGLDIPADVANSLELLSTSAQRMDQMLRDLLEYSRVGRFQTVECIDVPALVARILDEHPLPRGLTLTVNGPDAGFAFAQPDFTRALRCLLLNAIRHHDRLTGHVTVTVETDDRNLCLTVADDGPGIADRDRPLALDLFRTLKPRDVVEGSGMGLPIAQRVAQEHGGTLTIADAPDGRGCVVSVRLLRGQPLRLVPADDPSPQSVDPVLSGT